MKLKRKYIRIWLASAIFLCLTVTIILISNISNWEIEKSLVSNPRAYTLLLSTIGLLSLYIILYRYYIFETREIASQCLLELKVSETKYRTAFEAISAAIIAIDENGIIDSLNFSAEKTFGYSHEELCGKNVKLLMPEPYRSEHDNYIRQYLETGGAKIIGSGREAEGQRKDGSRFPIYLSVSKMTMGERPMFIGVMDDITERKQTEQNLSRFKTTLDMTQDCVFMFDPETLQFFYVNQGAVNQFGYSETELLNMTPVDIKPDYDEQGFRELLAPLINGPKHADQFQTEHRCRDGSSIPVEIILQYIAPVGQPPRFVAIVRDISERLRIAHQLEAREARLDFLLSASSVCIYTRNTDADYSASFVSGNVRNLFGYAPADFVQDPDFWTNHIHPDDRSKVKDNLSESEQCSHLTHQYRFKLKNGSYCWVYDELRLLRDEQGNPTEFIGTWARIDDLKKTEDNLQRMAKVFLDGTDPILIQDLEGQMVDMNKEAERIYGWERSDLLGKSAKTIVPKVRHGQLDELVDCCRQGDVIRNIEALHLTRSGDAFPVLLTLSLLTDDSGEPLGIATMAKDISERKRVEQQIIAARDKAEQATRSKSEFLANMSHEIRTPMNGVLGMIELLSGTEMDSMQVSYMETARDSAKLLLTIINDILDFSKIEAGQLHLEHVVFDLRKTVEDGVSTLANLAVQKHLGLNCFIHRDVADCVYGDPVRLRQVLTNLTSNAIKFSNVGEVDVSVNLLESDKQHALVRFEVKDKGIGIAEDVQRKLFEPFTQADGSTTRRFGGTGLGLSISKQLVELMGGQIGVNSSPGKGSTFWFTVKFESIVKQPFSRPSTLLSDKRVLVVDDSATNRMILTHYLTSWNIQNQGVENAELGLQQLRQAAEKGKAYDVILTDYQLPGINGLELAEKIKADTRLADTSVFILSSIGEINANSTQHAGVERCFVKPVRQSDLFDSLIKNAGLKVTDSVQPAARNPSDSSSLFKGRTVLLVDDMTTNQIVGMEMLRTMGINVAIVANGQEAVSAVARNDYDLVLMDCQMPVMDGYTATEVIRAQERAQNLTHLPIIALTGYAMQGDRETSLSAGMDDYLAKPFTQLELQTVLTRWLGNRAKSSAPIRAEKTATVDPKMAESNPTDALDQAKLKEIQGFAGEKFQLVAVSFSKDTQRVLTELRDCADQNDAVGVRHAAHALSGISLNVAAATMSEFCVQLETQARKGEIVDALDQIKMIEKEHERVIDALQVYL